MAFLRNRKLTIEPLQTFNALGVYLGYCYEIREHVENIRKPVEALSTVAAKPEPSLELSAKSGHHQYIDVRGGRRLGKGGRDSKSRTLKGFRDDPKMSKKRTLDSHQMLQKDRLV